MKHLLGHHRIAEVKFVQIAAKIHDSNRNSKCIILYSICMQVFRYVCKYKKEIILQEGKNGSSVL